MPLSPRARFFLAATLIGASDAALTLLLLTLLDHRLDRPPVRQFDLLAQARVHALTAPRLTPVMLALTSIGAIKIFATALALVLVYLVVRARRHEAALLGGAPAGAFALNETLKLHFHRLRPLVPWSLGDEHTFSFPSGHSLFSVVLYGTLAYIALRRPSSPRRRIGVLAPAILLPLGIGLSRIYLGMHFPTDVLAGWLTGALWLAAIIMIDHAWRARTDGRARI